MNHVLPGILQLCLSTVISLAAVAQTANIKEYKEVFTTYPYGDPDPVPNFSRFYPYFRYDGYTDTPVKQSWKVVALENDYIKVLILPEIGGKIWAAIEKRSGRPFIYYNHVVKFRDVAMRGPWTSGGIEANYGIMGHTPNCSTPVDYVTRRNRDGSVSCFIGTLDLLTRTRWHIEVNLPADKAYFTTRSGWHNATPLQQPYYHWMNTGVAAGDSLQFQFPGTQWIGHEGETGDWPVNRKEQKQIDWYAQNDFGGYHSYHVLGRYTDFFGAYWHDQDLGMAHYSPHDQKPGKKIWIWGLARQGMIWEKLLTDTDGQYVEIQSGRLFNQSADKSVYSPFKYSAFQPYATDQWIEYWYPVVQTHGFIAANDQGALNVRPEKGRLQLYFCPVQPVRDTLRVSNGREVIYTKALQLKPLQVFSDALPAGTDMAGLTIELGDHLLRYDSSSNGALNRPLTMPQHFDWSSAYGLYLRGKAWMEQRTYDSAAVYVTASLQKDNNFVPALVLQSELYYRGAQYTEALASSRKALSIDTYDGGANYLYGLVNRRLGNITDARDGLDMAALSPAWRSAAFTELASLYLSMGDNRKALAYAIQSRDQNRYNITSYELQAVALRHLHQQQPARKVLDTLLMTDTLNQFALCERYHWQPTQQNRQQLLSSIRNEWPDETLLELASRYYAFAAYPECISLLQLLPHHPLANYWIAWLQQQQGAAYDTWLQRADTCSPAFVFPFRPEMTPALEWAAAHTKSWKPAYYLALLYRQQQQTDKSRKWLQQCGDAPDYAPFYAFRYQINQNGADLQKAASLDKGQWRYQQLLAKHYIGQKQYKEALAVTEPFYQQHPQHYVMGLLHAKCLLLNNRFKDADQLLARINIIPFEGAIESRELYRQTKIMQALDAIQAKDYNTARRFITDARKWPENLGVGQPYDSEVNYKLENYLETICTQQPAGKVTATLPDSIDRKANESILARMQQMGLAGM